jgi:hypothetical protein
MLMVELRARSSLPRTAKESYGDGVDGARRAAIFIYPTFGYDLGQSAVSK